ncbi:MAG: SDR family oxidoreductase [Bdellovibrionales bacterium]
MNSAVEARPVALITGASTGIGLATAEKLLAHGMFVILTARESSLHRFDKIEFLKDPSRFWVRPLDVTRPYDRRQLVDEIEKKLGRLDILINNAGVIYRTPLEYAYEFESTKPCFLFLG